MTRSGVVEGTPLVSGEAEGPLLVLDEPLSFWGGLDAQTGRIIDVRHPQHGQIVSGRVLAMATGRGSSSSSTVLAEAIRAGTAPAAILLFEPDSILIVGALAARDLYGKVMPIVLIPGRAGLTPGRATVIDAAGGVSQ